MIKSKKLLLSLGLVVVASAPIIAAVSCGEKSTPPIAVNLDMTASTTEKASGVKTTFDAIYGSQAVNKGGYEFTVKPTANSTPLEWKMSAAEMTNVRNAQKPAAPQYSAEDTPWGDFIQNMKDATGTALTPGGTPQFYITKDEEKFLGLSGFLPTVGSGYDAAKAKTFTIEKIIKALPKTAVIKRIYDQNAVTNNFEVEFAKAENGVEVTPAVLQTVQFNCDVKDKKQSEVDQMNAESNTGKAAGANGVTSAIKNTYDDFSAKLGAMFEVMKSQGLSQKDVASTMISAFMDISYDFITAIIPGYSGLKVVPILGTIVTRIDTYIKSKFIPPVSTWLANKIYPTTQAHIDEKYPVIETPSDLFDDLTTDMTQIYIS